jgi:hypothetical protein
MRLSTLQRLWKIAGERLGLEVVIPFSLQLKGQHSLEADVLLRGYGAPQGMLIFSDYADLKGRERAVIRAGFGYSCMPQPSRPDFQSLEPVRDALEDWKPHPGPRDQRLTNGLSQ